MPTDITALEKMDHLLRAEKELVLWRSRIDKAQQTARERYVCRLLGPVTLEGKVMTRAPVDRATVHLPVSDLLRETEEELAVAATELDHAVDNKMTTVDQMDKMVVQAWFSQLEYERQVPEDDLHMRDVGGFVRAVKGARFVDAYKRLEVGALATHCSTVCVCVVCWRDGSPAAANRRNGACPEISNAFNTPGADCLARVCVPCSVPSAARS
jgi:hypothetical protein